MTYMEGYRPLRKTHFTRRCHKGIWKRIVESLSRNTDYELLTINSNCFKVRSYVSDAEGNNRVITAQKEGLCLVLWYRIL